MRLFRRKKHNNPDTWNVRTMFGPGLNFAAAEAYKLLRTNLMFSFPDERKCRIVGITSSIQEEGKSTVTCNLAYSLAQAGVSVLLIDADLRKPTIASKLCVERIPGLTNLLVSREDYKKCVQQSPYAPGVDLLTAGDIPPNPSELLGSDRMQELMEEMSKDYEYILVDLPPVTIVSDTVAVSKLLDGVIAVVRGGVAQKKLLAEMLRQLQLVDLRILGFVYRDLLPVNGRYYSRYKGKYHYYRTSKSDKDGKKIS